MWGTHIQLFKEIILSGSWALEALIFDVLNVKDFRFVLYEMMQTSGTSTGIGGFKVCDPSRPVPKRKKMRPQKKRSNWNMNFLALQFLLYILCLSPHPVEAAESKLESASIAGKINEQWLITAPVTCDGGLGGTEKLHFFLHFQSPVLQKEAKNPPGSCLFTETAIYK